jgi:hypothetical protein
VKLDGQSVMADHLGGSHLFARFEYENAGDTGFPCLNCEGQPGQGATHNHKIDLRLVHTRTIALTPLSGKSVTDA